VFSKLYKMCVTVNHTYLFTNYTHNDMFRLERVIIRLSIESYIRYIKCECTFWDPKKAYNNFTQIQN